MEVMMPSDNLDFDFNSARSSPQVSQPSSPKGFGGYYCSAPTSPSQLSRFYSDFKVESGGGGGSSAWEEKHGTPKSTGDFDFDFAFDVNGGGNWEKASLSAEELFDGGVIKPLTPQTQLPPRHKTKNETGPSAVAAQNATAMPPRRGRERGGDFAKSSSRRVARSLSPLRDTDQYPWFEEEESTEQPHPSAKNNPSRSTTHVGSTLSASNAKSQRKWRLRDFFLFRSASEGRAADKDPLKKYTAAYRHSSFRATDKPGSGSGSRRRGPVSAHEYHYTVNRAASEDLKKKTFLPYKQGILGRLAFNPAVHALANGFGFSRK